MKLSASFSRVALPAMIFASGVRPTADAADKVQGRSRISPHQTSTLPFTAPSAGSLTQWEQLQTCDPPAVLSLQRKFKSVSPLLCMDYDVYRQYQRAIAALSAREDVDLIRRLATASNEEGGLPHFMHALANCYGYALQANIEPKAIEPGQVSRGFDVPRATTCEQLRTQAMDDGALEPTGENEECPPGRSKMRAYVENQEGAFRDWHWLVFDEKRWLQKVPGLPSMPLSEDIDVNGPLPLQSFKIVYKDPQFNVFRVEQFQIEPYGIPCDFTLCSLKKV